MANVGRYSMSGAAPSGALPHQDGGGSGGAGLNNTVLSYVDSSAVASRA